MAFAHTAGVSTWPIRLYDSVDQYEIYLKTAPDNIKEEDVEILLVNETLGESEDVVIGWGAARRGWRINECKMRQSSASGEAGWIEIIKRAKQYWSRNNSTVYLTIKDRDGYNQAVISDNDSTGVSQATVRFIEYRRSDPDAENVIISIAVIKTS